MASGPPSTPRAPRSPLTLRAPPSLVLTERQRFMSTRTSTRLGTALAPQSVAAAIVLCATWPIDPTATEAGRRQKPADRDPVLLDDDATASTESGQPPQFASGTSELT